MVRKFKFLRVFTSMALLVVNHSILLPTNEEQNIKIRNISSLVTSVTLSPPPPIHFLGYTLPQGHPCHTFTLPPPPADNKRTGPRRIRYAKNFTKPVCFRHTILSLLGYETALLKGLSGEIDCNGESAYSLWLDPDNTKTVMLSKVVSLLKCLC
ncbi:Uncharacterized protein Rs2_04418 [Raphanus sativus]|nr:Uncharacterized protein Rs2_04418 [Raphanus sativus]